MSEKQAGWLSGFFDAKKKMDGWMNILTGIGTKGRDARMHSTVRWRQMSEVELEELYAGDAMAAKIVDLPVEEATEKGWKFTGISTEQEKKLSARLKELGFAEKLIEAWKKARLYGGAVILRVVNDNLDLASPLAPDAKQEIKSLIVLQRFDLFCQYENLNKDILSPQFRKPMRYTFNGVGDASMANVEIHHSRVTRFDGAWLPDKLYQRNGYWHDSVLSKPYDAIRNYAEAHDGVNAALKDLSVAVYKMKGLADLILSGADTEVVKRMEIVNLAKSIARAVVLDAEGEEFDYKTRNLTGANDLVTQSENRLSAETNIPKTVLLGISAQGGGLANNGNHDSENWYNFLETQQTNHLKPRALEIAKAVAQELGIPHESMDMEFTPLWQMSEKEEVEMRERQSQTDQRYFDMGVLDQSEIRKSRFGGEKYSIDTKIDPTVTPAPLDLSQDPPDGGGASGKFGNENREGE